MIAFAAAVLSVTSGLRGTDPAFVAIAITYAVLVSHTHGYCKSHTKSRKSLYKSHTSISSISYSYQFDK